MMDAKYLAEIKAREQAATSGPWTYTDNGFDGYISSENGKFQIGGEPCEGRIENDADTDFISHARTDIPALIAEVERLTEENQGLRANSIVQEHIISGGRDPIKDGEIARLIMDNAAKDQQIATLKRALELACYELAEALGNSAYQPAVRTLAGGYYNDFIHQAQGQEGKK